MKYVYTTGLVLSMVLFPFSRTFTQNITIFPLHDGNDHFFIDQLWQLTIANLTSLPINGTLEIRLETDTHIPVITAVTPIFTFNKGVTTLSSTVRSQMQLVYGMNEKGSLLRETGRLPLGRYILCYICRQTDGTQIGLHCRERLIRPLTPPELVYPENESVIETSYPLLMWRAPFPLQMESIRYNLRLAEVPSGMSSVAALNLGQPILNMVDYKDPFLSYPSSAPALDTGKVYAWQIAARSMGFDLGVTEIWTFKVERPIPDSIKVRYQSYCWVKNYEDGTFCHPVDTLKFVYNNQAMDSILNFSIIDKDNDTLYNSLQIRLIHGINAVEIPMQRLGDIKNGVLYRIIITDKKKQRYTLLFRKRRNH